MVFWLIAAAVALVIVAGLVLRVSRPQLSARASRPGEGGARLAALRRDLMLKALHDESKVEAWVDYERARFPGAGEEELHQRAIDRWERDNR